MRNSGNKKRTAITHHHAIKRIITGAIKRNRRERRGEPNLVNLKTITVILNRSARISLVFYWSIFLQQ
jgi:hypothetical protein